MSFLAAFNKFQVVRRGPKAYIVRRFQTICHARGAWGIQLALDEIEKPVETPDPRPEWLKKIEYINNLCEQAKARREIRA